MCTITFSVSISTTYDESTFFPFDYWVLISESSTTATAPSSAGSLEACESVTSARAAASAAAAAVGSVAPEDVLQSSLALAAAPLACDFRLNGGGEGGFAGASRLLRRNNTATSKCEI